MRILWVAQKLYPDVTGGGPYHAHAMSRYQATMGHETDESTIVPMNGSCTHGPLSNGRYTRSAEA